MSRELELKRKREDMARRRADPEYRQKEREKNRIREKQRRALLNGHPIEGEVLVGWLHRPKCLAMCDCKTAPVYAEISSGVAPERAILAGQGRSRE